MRCPFPGMDPYLECPEIWPDFHDRLITFLCGELQPMLRPRYAALTQDRLYVVESNRPVRPDVGIIRTRSNQSRAGTATLEADAPTAVFDFEQEQVREPLIHIIEPAAGNRIVTAIEVLSPDNKRKGPGRVSYLRKRKEYWLGGANLIEIDLLRDGGATLRVAPERLEALKPWTYLIGISRIYPCRQEVFAISLRSRLPKIPVPLADDDADVTLDIQAAFTRCWDEGPYPELLGYGHAPKGTFGKDDAAWASEIAEQKRP